MRRTAESLQIFKELLSGHRTPEIKALYQSQPHIAHTAVLLFCLHTFQADLFAYIISQFRDRPDECGVEQICGDSFHKSPVNLYNIGRDMLEHRQ